MKKHSIQHGPLLTTGLLLLTLLGTSVSASRVTALEPPKVVYPHLSARQLAAPSIWKTHAAYFASDLTWSPNGRWAAYRLREALDHLTHEDGDWEINSLCVIRADGSQARRLDTREWMSPEIAGWSADSRRILFWPRNAHSSSLAADGSCLYDVPVTGGTARLLTRPFRTIDGDLDDWMMRKPRNLAFSPDGKSLLLVVGGGRNSYHNKRLERLSYPAGHLQWRTRAANAVSDPALSPDGRHIAFIACSDPGPLRPDGTYSSLWRESHSHLWIIDTEGRHKRQLTADGHYYESGPKWVQGNALIRFTRNKNPMDDSDNGSKWEIHMDGSGLQPAQRSKEKPGRKPQEKFDTARLNAARR